MSGQSSKILTKMFVTFTMGEHHYAINAVDVIEIKDYRNVEINNTQGPDYIKGLTYFNKKMTPIVDLQKLLGEHAKITSDIRSILFVQVDQDTSGLIIYDLPNITSLEENEFSVEQPKVSSLFSLILNTKKLEIFRLLNLKQLLLDNKDKISSQTNNNIMDEKLK